MVYGHPSHRNRNIMCNISFFKKPWNWIDDHPPRTTIQLDHGIYVVDLNMVKKKKLFLMLKPHKLGWPFLQILGCSRGAPWARRSSRLWRFNRLWTGDVRPRFRAGKAFHFMVIMVKPMAILNWASKKLSLPLEFGMFLLPFGGQMRWPLVGSDSRSLDIISVNHRLVMSWGWPICRKMSGLKSPEKFILLRHIQQP